VAQSEAEQCIKRIQSHKGVKRVFVINARGQTIRSSLNDPEEERRYAGLISELTKKTQSMVRELNPDDSLKFLRIRTSHEEIMIAPEPNEQKYTLIVVQDPSDEDAAVK
jgi:dynein light chain roadblock-type